MPNPNEIDADSARRPASRGEVRIPHDKAGAERLPASAMAYLRRRASQVRQAGMIAAVRIASARLGGAAIAGLDGLASRLRSPGLKGWRRMQPPQRIVAPAPTTFPGGLKGPARGEFSLLGVAARPEVPRSCGDLGPGPWRRAIRKIGPLVGGSERGLDWHHDPGSSFRWRQDVRSRSIRYGDQPEVDVKWPWELGRLQHLPPMAFGIPGAATVEAASSMSVISGHVRDFIRANPPGFGVQWICTMDVGIRIANILLAVDLARAAGADFGPDFLRLVSATARDHGRHIVRNLEWGDRLCSNHYLANIAGLLYVGAYLQDDPEASEWLAFAGREMVHQIRAQFHPEGSNFEASTCYHRLSAEMAIHSAALMLWISRNQPARAARWWSGPVRNFHPSPAAPPTPKVRWPSGPWHPFDGELQRRLAGMGRFTESILRDDGSVPQVGDNDSGRFLRLEMSDAPYADIDDHRHLVRASRALFGQAPEAGAESSWMSAWLGDATLPPQPDEPCRHWHGFGLFTWRTPRFLCTLRCGHVGQLGNGGHAHCDQLSITLSTPAGRVIDDPGTGVYTPQPSLRNELRSSACHSTVLVPGREQGEWLPGRWGLFSMRDRANARLLHCDSAGAAAEMFEGDALVRREIQVHGRGLRILDSGPAGAVANFILGPEAAIEARNADSAVLRVGTERWRLSGSMLQVDSCPWSSRYGHRMLTQRIRCRLGKCDLTLE